MIPSFKFKLDTQKEFDNLPSSARTKFFDIQNDAKIAHAGMAPWSEQICDLIDREQPIAARLRDLEHSHFKDEKAIELEKERIAAIRDERDRAQRGNDAAAAAWRNKIGLATNLENYVSALPGNAKLTPLPAPAPQLRKGEALVDALTRVRSQIEAIKNTYLPTNGRAPLPKALIKAHLIAKVDALAEKAKPFVFADGSLNWPGITLEDYARIHDRQSVGRVELVEWLALLNRDAIVGIIEREIDAKFDDVGALTDEEKRERDQKLRAELLQLERAEEGMVLTVRAAGMNVERRPDADPRAVLEIEGPAPKSP